CVRPVKTRGERWARPSRPSQRDEASPAQDPVAIATLRRPVCATTAPRDRAWLHPDCQRSLGPSRRADCSLMVARCCKLVSPSTELVGGRCRHHHYSLCISFAGDDRGRVLHSGTGTREGGGASCGVGKEAL